MLPQQFEDLPQIQYLDETRFHSWPTNYYGYPYPEKLQPVALAIMDDSFGVDYFDDSMMSMQPMQRFMCDPSPQTFGLLNANIPLQNQYQKQYTTPWPSSEPCRNASPDRTSVSGTSSYASPNEVHSPYAYNAVPYGSPVESFLPSMPYHGSEHLSNVARLTGTSGPSVDPKEVEYERQDPEPTIEEVDTVDIKYGPTVASEQVLIKTENDPSAYREDTDSGIGNSMRDAESVQPVGFKHESDEDSDYNPRNQSGKRKRSAPNTSRAPKRRSGIRRDSVMSTTSPKKPGRKPRSTLKFKTENKHQDDCRPFPCPLAGYNCTSTFSSKNEWKRHVSTQHIKLGFWRCDLCAPTTDSNDPSELYYNDFNRKDLFTQHLRRMHAAEGSGARHNRVHPVTEENIGEHQTRCYRQLRCAPQQSICPFNGCDREFVGSASWEERMEHVGRHLEKDRRNGAELNIASWKPDTSLEQYLVDEDLIVWEHGVWKTSDGKSRRPGSDSSDED